MGQMSFILWNLTCSFKLGRLQGPLGPIWVGQLAPQDQFQCALFNFGGLMGMIALSMSLDPILVIINNSHWPLAKQKYDSHVKNMRVRCWMSWYLLFYMTFFMCWSWGSSKLLHIPNTSPHQNRLILWTHSSECQDCKERGYHLQPQ